MNWQLAFSLFLMALPGSIVTATLALPVLLDGRSLPLSLTSLQIITLAQSAFLTATAAVVGTRLADDVGLRCPLLFALLKDQDILMPLHSQVLPVFVGGVMGGVIIWGFSQLLPASRSLPLIVGLLYGGITEEVLMRWGVMTFLAWLGWRMGQGGVGQISVVWMGTAIFLSAVIFGLSHLPVFDSSGSHPSLTSVSLMLSGNTLFGLLAGYLFWQYGLEAAMLTHALAHVLAVALPMTKQ
ncbi:CPBP family intramembrane metalloprotease [Thermosynechococcus sp. HN-54]|uniref:CPBP family intramembrane glutamic endopeptidase n=1 Tax=Thermosynechococcus sp. HN-54 TaxID=2933959 RepID=UPI00202CCF31|nr:CPBP family intramembrane glutamic endopeptidase [Thermosynechococcus sp. HN-54]URR35698.1 CPBP family intramembrane metalloprotease [Thermosynechococcus sp. HN-54]